jgi:hypothetical protein
MRPRTVADSAATAARLVEKPATPEVLVDRPWNQDAAANGKVIIQFFPL